MKTADSNTSSPQPRERKYFPAYQRRRGQAVKHLVLTERDLAVLYHLYTYRALNSTQILKLLGLAGTSKAYKYLNRLKHLYDNHYVDRIRRRDYWVEGGGSRPLVYALGNRGADVLHERFKLPRARVDWTAKNKVKDGFIDHTLMVAEFMVDLHGAVAARDDLRLIDQDELLASQVTEQHRRSEPAPRGWTVPYPRRDGQRVASRLVPDRLFALARADGKRAHFFLEADCGTEPLRARKDRSQIYKKLVQYRTTAREQLLVEHYGFAHFTALFVTTGRERASHMIVTNRAAADGKGWRRFLFTTREAIAETLQRPQRTLFDVPWRNGREESVTLVSELGL